MEETEPVRSCQRDEQNSAVLDIGGGKTSCASVALKTSCASVALKTSSASVALKTSCASVALKTSCASVAFCYTGSRDLQSHTPVLKHGRRTYFVLKQTTCTVHDYKMIKINHFIIMFKKKKKKVCSINQ
jgi:hypothetical protein